MRIKVEAKMEGFIMRDVFGKGYGIGSYGLHNHG